MYYLFALENLKILKKMLNIAKSKKSLMVRKNWTKHFRQKLKSVLFHLILWAFEIKNKKGEKNFIYVLLLWFTWPEAFGDWNEGFGEYLTSYIFYKL